MRDRQRLYPSTIISLADLLINQYDCFLQGYLITSYTDRAASPQLRPWAGHVGVAFVSFIKGKNRPCTLPLLAL